MKVRTSGAVRVNPDRLLLASVEDLSISEGFRAFIHRLADMRDKHVRDLVTLKEPVDIYRTQGRIEALGRAMELHQILKQEIGSKLKGQTTT